MKKYLVILSVALAGWTATAQGTLEMWTTGTANQQINVNNQVLWNFAVLSTVPYTDLSFIAQVQNGGSDSAPLVLTLWSGLNASGSALGATSIFGSTIGTGFKDVQFGIPNLLVTAGDYSLVLSSAVANKDSFMVKLGDLVTSSQFVNNLLVAPMNSPNTPSSSPGSGSAPSYTITTVPEPSTLTLAALGGATLLMWRRRK